MREEDFRLLLDALADAVIAADETNAIVYANDAAERLLGYERGELIGCPIVTIVPERLRATHLTGFERYVRGGPGRLVGRAVRVPALHKEGREIEVELRLSDLQLSGARRLFLASMRDLQERIALERKEDVLRFSEASTRAAAAMASRPEVVHVARVAAFHLVQGFDAVVARVWLWEGGSLCLRGSEGPTSVTRIDPASYPYLAGVVARTRRAVIKNELRADPEIEPNLTEQAATACFPLLVGDALRGVMEVYFRERIDEDVARVLQTFSVILASVLNDAQLLERERAAHTRFYDFVSGIDHGFVWESDARDMALTFVSPRIENVLGVSAESITAERRRFADLTHPDDRPRVEASLRHVLDGGVMSLEHRAVAKDGRVVWLHTGARMAKLNDQRLIHALSMDVTPLKESEARLREQRDFHRLVAASLSDGLFTLDRAGRVTSVNAAAEHMLGWTEGELLGRDMHQAIHHTRPDGRPFPVSECEGKAAIRDGYPYRNERDTFIKKDGTLFKVAYSSAPMQDAQGSVVVFRDVERLAQAEDSLKSSEARWKVLAEAGGALSASLDYEETLEAIARVAVGELAEGCVVDFPDHELPVAVAHVNPEMQAAILEYRRLRPPTRQAAHGAGAVMRTRTPELVPEIPLEELLRHAEDPQQRALLEKLGTRSYLCVPMISRGNVVGALTFVSSTRRLDVADLRLAQELAQRAAQAIDNARLYREAQEAVKLRDEFLSIASHELRTPLTPLLLHVQALERATTSAGPIPRDRLIRSLSVAKRQVQRFTALIENLLDVSRIQGNRLHINLDDIDLSPVVVDACGRFRDEAQRVGSSLEMDIEPSVTGIWDRLRLDQVVTNLLSNALKYGAGKPVEVSLRANEDTARLVVKDHGIGIDPKDVERIFGRFERAASMRSYGGLGLGLYIVRQIATAHEGTVVAGATPGGGATFVVELPRRLRKGEVAS